MEKILIIDDDEFILGFMTRVLEPDYATCVCNRGSDGLTCALNHRPDLILLDVIMDDMDGYEVCRQLKANLETREIPVIFISSLDSAQDETKGLLLGAIDYLSKPINPSIVLARIANHLKLKRHENELRKLYLTMEDLVQQRTAQLREALEAAKIADKTKDEFLANITHELRTPLSAIIGFSSLALPFCTSIRQREYLDKVTQAGRTLSRVINDLLDLSKIAAGRMELESTTFSLRSLLNRDSAMMSYRTEEKGLELIQRIDEEVPDVLLGDPLRLEQILLNLLSNAVKFTQTGKIEVRIGLHARKENRICLDIEVEDTGIGMRQEDLEKMFIPFSQADASMNRKYGGSGLGLAISRRLAEIMEGDISVISREGIGTTFRVRIWLGLGDPGDLPCAVGEEQDRAQMRYRDVRVLVVDDQPFNRDVVEGLLAVVGISPHLAEHGQEALDILSNHDRPFDLILMDIQMPVMDGLMATKAIRKLDGYANVPIIAMTAHTMLHEREQTNAAGLNDHIGKPFDEASFYQMLMQWIPRSKQHLQLAARSHQSASVSFPSLHNVDTRAGLSLLQGDEVRYRHWLKDFIAEAPAALAQVRQALAAGERESASMTAHALKGRLGLLGMNALHAVAAEIEKAIDQAEPTAGLLHDLDTGIAAMCAEIQRVL